MGSFKARQLWDFFIEAESSSYERSTWCDLFISHVLAESHKGKPIQDIINFSNLSAIGTLIGCEILSDINQVVNQPGDIEDIRPLRHHLLTKGWRGFAFLLLIGRQNLACSKELAHLLLFLYPLCLNNAQTVEKTGYLKNSYIKLPNAAVSEILLQQSSNKIHVRCKASSSVEFVRSSCSSRARRFHREKDETISNPSSDEHATSLPIRIGLFKLDPMDFEYFTNIVRSDDDTRLDSVLYEPVRRPSRVVKLFPQDLTDEYMTDVLQSKVSPEEFSQLVVQLLISLATAEHTFPACADNSYPTCTQCIKFALENLCSLQFNSSNDVILDTSLIGELKVGWTQLLVICLDKVMGCRDVTCSVILAGVLPMMLRVLEDVVNKLTSENNPPDPKGRLEEVALGLVSGSIAFVHSMLLQSTSSLESVKTTVELITMMLESGNGRLLDRAVFACDSIRLIELLGHLMNALKRVRWRTLGKEKSGSLLKGRRGRAYLVDAHHHVDAWGAVSSSHLLSAREASCCVSSLFMVFVRILQNADTSTATILTNTLRVMTGCGTCCCFPAKPLMKVFAKLIRDGSPRVRVLIFTLLEKTIYPQLSLYDHPVDGCTICSDTSVKVWDDFQLLKDLIINEGGKAGPVCVVHLLRVAPRFNAENRSSIIFKIFFPAFLSAKVTYLKERNEPDEFLIVSSLTAFADLLNEKTMSEFLYQNAVEHILELSSIPALSKHCSTALEKIILLEANQDSSDMSCWVLLKKAADAANSAFLGLLKADAHRATVGVKRRKQADTGNRMELLQNISVFWKCFSNLVFQNDRLKNSFASDGLLEDGLRLLEACLVYITSKAIGESVAESNDIFKHYFFKLIECLLAMLMICQNALEDSIIYMLELHLLQSRIHLQDTQKICETLIKCSLARSKNSILPSKAPIVPLWAGWTEDIPKITHTEIDSDSSDNEDPYVTADEGYEADIELKDNIDPSTEQGSISSETLSKPCESEKSFPNIIHPKLNKVAVQLLIKIFSEQQRGDKTWAVIESVFGRLTAICRDNTNNCLQLCDQGLILLVLEGFSTLLRTNESKSDDSRKIVLEFICLLGKHAITKDELVVYLSFFKASSPNLMQLLTPLVTLCENSPPQPYFVLNFPTKNAFDHKPVTGIQSCWSTAPFSLTIPPDIGWSPWLSGCALSFWVRIDRPTAKSTKPNIKLTKAHHTLQIPSIRNFSRSVSLESDKKATRKFSMPSRKVSRAESHFSAHSTELSDWNFSFDEDFPSLTLSNQEEKIQNHYHLFSLGSNSLMLECWTDPLNDVTTFRLLRAEDQNIQLLTETQLEGILPSNSWHHIAINVKDYMHHKKTIVELSWIRNGSKLIRVILPFVGVLVRKPKAYNIYLGMSLPRDFDLKATYSVSNLFFFRTPVFTEERAMCLLGLGPNFDSLADCLIQKSFLNFSSVLKPELVSSFNWNSIFERKSAVLRELRSKILLSYSPKDQYTYCIFQTTTLSNNGTLLFRINSTDLSPAQSVPRALSSVDVFKSIDASRVQNFTQAAILTGGIPNFLFLLARVVELKAVEEEQAEAFSLLLKLAQSDNCLYSQFIGCEYHKLLRKIFQTSLCAPSYSSLKSIFGACCNVQLFDDLPQAMESPVDVLLKDSTLFMELFTAWLYPVKDRQLLVKALRGFNLLIREENQYSEFNTLQLKRVHALSTILNFAKNALMSEKKSIVSNEACLCIVDIVRCLMGAPPEFSHIVSVMDCLLLLHPANATYITHVKNTFYQLLSAGQRYTIHGPLHDARNLPQTEQWVKVYHSRPTSLNLKSDSFTLPVDSDKLTKALTNLQIKRSMSSENQSSSSAQRDDQDSNRYSDEATIDSGISGSCRDHPELNDYVVVKAVDGSQQNLRSFFPAIVPDVDSDDVKEEDDPEEKRFYDEVVQESEQSVLVEGLLLVLKDVVLVLPDNMAVQVLRYVVQFEILLVIANHGSPDVRAAVVQLLSSYLRRATDEDRNKFLKTRGFHHLANQIALFPATFQLADSCLKLISPYVDSIEDPCLLAQCELSTFSLASVPPLLALMPRSVHNPNLVHCLINVLRIIYLKNGLCSRALLDNGLIEVLVKSLLASAHISKVTEQITSQDIVTADLEGFFNAVASQCLLTPGVQNMQVVNDMRLQLIYASRVERESCGIKTQCVRTIREIQCKFVERCVDLLFEKIMSLQTDSSRFLGDEMSSITSSQSSVSFTGSVPVTNGKELSKRDLKDRFSSVLLYCSQLLIYEEIMDGKHLLVNATEQDFIHHIFPLFLQMLTFTMEKRSYGRRSGANGVLWAVRETLKTEAAELLVWLISPRQSLPIRLFAINTLLSSTKCKDLLKSFIQSSRQVEQRFTVFLWDLMYNSKMTERDMRSCMELKECLQQWDVLSPYAVGHSHDEWDAECDLLLHQTDKMRISWEKCMEPALIRCVTKQDSIVKSMSEDAMTMTRKVVDSQNVERKTLMSNLRKFLSEDVQIVSRWKAMIESLTHPRALWHFPETQPGFWQLDPTEGPHRIRIRLAPTKLYIDSRYLKEDHRWKLDSENCAGPISFLFQRHKETCSSLVVIDRLNSNEIVRSMALARIITPAQEVPGEILLGEFSIYFVADDEHSCQALDAGSTAWPFEDIREIHHRRFQHQERALEIFLRTGRAYLVAFQTCKDKEVFAEALSQCDLPTNLNHPDTLPTYTTLWRERKITNWEYLTQLNKIAGRSYNDLMQYPVFPFVLADYSGNILDLNKPSSFRNLKKPMAVQEPQNEQHYIDNYNELLVQTGLKQLTLNKGPYHYGSHYSNSGTVLHFLVRLPPFTTMLLQYQDRNFDLPDRTFHSMPTTWRLTSCDSTTDVKEMLPEFFYLPDFLVNSQGLDLGVRQNGQRVEDVELPPWSKADPRRFILIHRQALESAFVTENLPHWIDLVFGYKQTGKAAVDAINVFHPATYCGFDIDSIQDPLERIAWETMVKTYGQTPRQLFRVPHPFVIQNLTPHSGSSREVVPEVKGLRWGNYVGSPSEGDPKIIWQQSSKDQSKISCLLSFATNDVYALPSSTACLVRYTKEKEISLVNSTTIRVALVSWNYPDGLIRVKFKKEVAFEPLMAVSPLDKVTICSSAPESNQLWMGHQSGNLTVIRFSFKPDKSQLDFPGLPIQLQAHAGPVTALIISPQFSIVVSGSTEGSIIIWDLNKVSFVRSVDVGEPVCLISISPTLGDIACVTSSSTSNTNTSLLNIYSINAVPIKHVTVRDNQITSLCYSSAMEGISVNAIASGLADGVIRLWSSWDLSHIRDIESPIRVPVTSLTYSFDSQHLFAGFDDGTVIVWESSSVKYEGHPPKFLNLKHFLAI